MTYFHTCRACVADGVCDLQNAMKAAIANLGIRSLKHRCADRVDLFEPGDPVLVNTWESYDRGADGDELPLRDWFKGHFIRYAAGRKPLVYVAAGTLGEGGEAAFDPNGNGFLKVALARVKPRDGDPIDVEACGWCGCILGVGQPCGRDPNYTPSRSCLQAQRDTQGEHGQGPMSAQGNSGRPT